MIQLAGALRVQVVILASLFAFSANGEDIEFDQIIKPVLQQYCVECHSTQKKEGELDLEQFANSKTAAQHPKVWERVLEQLSDGEMPPKDKPQLPSDLQTKIKTSLQEMLDQWALANAGDPGEVVLRRLSNREYTYTLRDLTGIETLDPAREFPVDGAAGEGFTNVGAALVMSASSLTKYLDAAKEVASHAVFLPDGIRFSSTSSRRDWTNESLARIRDFYRQFTINTQESVSVGGTGLVSSDGGRIPLDKYLAALREERTALTDGKKSIDTIAGERKLSSKYLGTLWSMLHDQQPSLLLEMLQTKWRKGELSIADIEPWQASLWRFTNIGHLGKVGGPMGWMNPVSPLASQQEFRVKLAAPSDGQDIVVYLSADDALDGNEEDYALWENARIVSEGRPDLPLKDIRDTWQRLRQRRSTIAATSPQYLAAAHDAQLANDPIDIASLSKKHYVDSELLAGWLTYLGFQTSNDVEIGSLLTGKTESVSNYGFIQGWVGENAYSVLANSSDATVQIPGTLKPFSVATHPSPTLASVVGWRCPEPGEFIVEGTVQDVHTACGNGVSWAIEVRRGKTRETLSSGVTTAGKVSSAGRLEKISMKTGDMVALVIAPGSGNHSCDLTAIELTIRSKHKEWSLAKDIVPDILAGNPHADRHGNPQVWYFFGEPESRSATPTIPPQSILARWRQTTNGEERGRLAFQVQHLLQQDFDAIPTDSPDRKVHTELLSLHGPLLASKLPSLENANHVGLDSRYGLDPALFGKHPLGRDVEGRDVEANSICVRAPVTLEVRLPADLVQGAELVVQGRLHPTSGDEGSVQLQATKSLPSQTGLRPSAFNSAKLTGAWTSSLPSMTFESPVLVHAGSTAQKRLERAFHDFRQLFPAAACYTTIVPVDEVVTLTLFHREDEPLSRLLLDDQQRATLDRLWAELHFVSQDALTLVDAFQQIWEYSTQDGPNAPHGDKRLEPLREPILRKAEEFKQFVTSVEPMQLEAVVRLADQAWRRPLNESERRALRELYQSLRNKDVAHEEAVRITLARILTSPAFLYRGELVENHSGLSKVSDWELATRLSYFLWSSSPDEELRTVAANGTLFSKEVLTAQTRRMLQDGKVRRLATEFGCQWLHIRDLETLNEKSERHFPTFIDLRDDMQEEAVRFFMDMFQSDLSVLSLLGSDHSFMNAELAKHYGLQLPSNEWQRVDGLRAGGRGGILGFAATLARQSGASRTSPILRGNWVSEVILGEKLPRPPKDVPILPEETPDGLTERQLIERHSSDAKCANCHKRIDHFGFALEGFDAIGRSRHTDAAGLQIDTLAKLPEGGDLNGLDGLRSYLLEKRQDDFLRQFCRKLLGYALGRSVQLSDKPLLDEMLVQLKSTGYCVSTAIELIVHSSQFQQIRGRD